MERESTRLFREARRARRLGGESAGAALGQLAAKVASSEPSGIRSYTERKARESMNADILRQTAAIQAGYTPSGTRAASGNVLNSRQNLFKKMQSVGSPEELEAYQSEAESLGVTPAGFEQAVRKIADRFDAPSAAPPVPAAPAAVPTAPVPPTAPAPVKAPLTSQQKRMKEYENQRRSRMGLPPLP